MPLLSSSAPDRQVTNFDEVSLRSDNKTLTVDHDSAINSCQLNRTCESVELRDLLKVEAQPISWQSMTESKRAFSVDGKTTPTASNNEHTIASQKTWPLYPFANVSRKNRPSYLTVDTSKSCDKVHESVESPPYYVLNRPAAIELMSFQNWRSREMSVHTERGDKILSTAVVTHSDLSTRKDSYDSSQCETLQVNGEDKLQGSGKSDQFTENSSLKVAVRDSHSGSEVSQTGRLEASLYTHAPDISQDIDQEQDTLKVQPSNTHSSKIQ